MFSINYGTPKKRLLVLPPISIAYSLISVGVVLALLTVVDRLLLPAMADQGKIVGQNWITDNSRLYEFMAGRNKANEENPVWRSSTYPVEEARQPGQKRILVMGDSFVWGDGSANMNDIWWRRLQNELDRRGYHNVEVVSAGLCGAATHRELKWAEKLVKTYKPDMIVWGYVTNDPEEGSEHSGQGIVKQIQLPKDEAFDSFWSQASNVFPSFTGQLSSLRNKNMTAIYSGEKYGYDYNTWSQKILQGKNWDAYKKTVKRMGDFAKESQIPSTVITLCMPWEQRASITPVENEFKANGLDFHNLLPDLEPWYKHVTATGVAHGVLSLAVNPANGHPGVTLTDYYAREAADILEKSYPQVLGEKTAENNTEVASGPAKVNDFVPPGLGVSNPQENTFTVYYPSKENDFLNMPLKRPYVLLSLAKPTAIKEIKVAGKNLKGCSLAVRSIDRNSGDVVVATHDLGTKKGGGSSFGLPQESWTGKVDEILLSCNVDGPDRLVVVKLDQQ